MRQRTIDFKDDHVYGAINVLLYLLYGQVSKRAYELLKLFKKKKIKQKKLTKSRGTAVVIAR